MSSANIRHRPTAKHSVESEPVHIVAAKIPNITARQHAQLHVAVWVRVVAIIGLFTCAVLLLSRVGVGRGDAMVDAGRSGGAARVGGPKARNEGSGKPLFVTVVMPSVVKPDARPLRLTNIAKTWGPSSNAVHSKDEYPSGDFIDNSSSGAYPKNLVVPEHITVDKGVERLQHVIRTIFKDVNPDFAFFVNDHTFVLPDHLCAFLKGRDSSEDLYAGHLLKGKGESAFNSGAAGYVLSRRTMGRIIKEWATPQSKCSPENASKWLQGNPGLLTAKCFGEVLKVPMVDTRDKRDLSHLFHAYGIVRTVSGKVDDWYMKKHETLDGILGVDERFHHRLQSGAECCSIQTISFHYVESGESLAFWEVLQTIHKSPGMSDDDIKDLMNKVWPRDKEGLGGYAHGLPGPKDALWKDIIQVVRKISAA
ncbi:hypothetical protein ACHAXT_008400 [Thalassiosira profunda]